jgi:hypothetical protein
MPNEAPYGHGCPPEPVAGKASKYRIHGPESAKAGGWAARPGDKVPQQGHRNPAAAKRTSLPKAANLNKGIGTRRQPKNLPAEGSYKP